MSNVNYDYLLDSIDQAIKGGEMELAKILIERAKLELDISSRAGGRSNCSIIPANQTVLIKISAKIKSKSLSLIDVKAETIFSRDDIKDKVITVEGVGQDVRTFDPGDQIKVQSAMQIVHIDVPENKKSLKSMRDLYSDTKASNWGEYSTIEEYFIVDPYKILAKIKPQDSIDTTIAYSTSSDIKIK